MEKGKLNSIKTIINSPGWNILKELLKEEIDSVTEDILKSDEAENKLKAKRDAFLYLLELPEQTLKDNGVEEIEF